MLLFVPYPFNTDIIMLFLSVLSQWWLDGKFQVYSGQSASSISWGFPISNHHSSLVQMVASSVSCQLFSFIRVLASRFRCSRLIISLGPSDDTRTITSHHSHNLRSCVCTCVPILVFETPHARLITACFDHTVISRVLFLCSLSTLSLSCFSYSHLVFWCFSILPHIRPRAHPTAHCR